MEEVQVRSGTAEFATVCVQAVARLWQPSAWTSCHRLAQNFSHVCSQRLLAALSPTMLRLLGAALYSLTTRLHAEAPEPVAIPYSSFEALDERALARLAQAFIGPRSYGQLIVEGVPGLAAARAGMFEALAGLAYSADGEALRAASSAPRQEMPGWVGVPKRETHHLQSSFSNNLLEELGPRRADPVFGANVWPDPHFRDKVQAVNAIVLEVTRKTVEACDLLWQATAPRPLTQGATLSDMFHGSAMVHGKAMVYDSQFSRDDGLGEIPTEHNSFPPWVAAAITDPAPQQPASRSSMRVGSTIRTTGRGPPPEGAEPRSFGDYWLPWHIDYNMFTALLREAYVNETTGDILEYSSPDAGLFVMNAQGDTRSLGPYLQSSSLVVGLGAFTQVHTGGILLGGRHAVKRGRMPAGVARMAYPCLWRASWSHVFRPPPGVALETVVNRGWNALMDKPCVGVTALHIFMAARRFFQRLPVGNEEDVFGSHEFDFLTSALPRVEASESVQADVVFPEDETEAAGRLLGALGKLNATVRAHCHEDLSAGDVRLLLRNSQTGEGLLLDGGADTFAIASAFERVRAPRREVHRGVYDLLQPPGAFLRGLEGRAVHLSSADRLSPITLSFSARRPLPREFVPLSGAEDVTAESELHPSAGFVFHVDQFARRALTAAFALLFAQAKGAVDLLDLCASWDSHYPAGVQYGRVSGVGLFETELAANPRLTERQIQDLNENPFFAKDNMQGAYDFVTVTAGVAYLRKAREVFREVHGVLRVGGTVVVSFSHHFYHAAASPAWRSAHREPMAWVCYVESLLPPGEWGPVSAVELSTGGDPLWVVTATKVSDFSVKRYERGSSELAGSPVYETEGALDFLLRPASPYSEVNISETTPTLIEGFLTPQECAQLVAICTALGFTGLANVSARFSRLPHVTNVNLELGDAVREALSGRLPGRPEMNALVRVFRYAEGGHFLPHFDSAKRHPTALEKRSTHTLLVYLNDDYSGGATTFMEEVGGPAWASFRPLRGAALIFPHGASPASPLHGSHPVLRGTKLLLRAQLFCGSAPTRKAEESPPAAAYACADAQVSADQRTVEIEFGDNAVFRFRAAWLCDAREDAWGRDHNRLYSSRICLDARAASASCPSKDAGGIVLLVFVSEQVPVRFTSAVLRAESGVAARLLKPPRGARAPVPQEPHSPFFRPETRTSWGAELRPSTFEYWQVARSDAAKLRLVRMLLHDPGFAVVTGVPVDDKDETDRAFARVVEELVAPFEVQRGQREPYHTIRSLDQHAELSAEFDDRQQLRLHTDRSSHGAHGSWGAAFVTRKGNGSMLLSDGLRVAESLSAESLATLTATPVGHGFLNNQYDPTGDLRDLSPGVDHEGFALHGVVRGHVEVDRDGRFQRITWSSRKRGHAEVSYAAQPAYFRAIEELRLAIENVTGVVEVPMAPNTLLLVNNHRVLHGRGHVTRPRILRGAYFMYPMVENQARTLAFRLLRERVPAQQLARLSDRALALLLKAWRPDNSIT